MPKPIRQFVAIAMLSMAGATQAQLSAADLQATYGFLVRDREQGGVLYAATARALDDARLPLSFVDSADYWGLHVCRNNAALCAITDVYDPYAYTLRPQKSFAGDLQTERVNTHNGTNIYDAATWQIAVMLGSVRNRFKIPGDGNAYELVSNQNRLLQLGYGGDASPAVEHQHRALTRGPVFRYNGHEVDEPHEAFVFRTVPRAWLSTDPLIESRYGAWIKATGLPLTNPSYQRGRITWTDWKPISGENAWAFLIGPLQAAYLHYHVAQKGNHVPFDDIAIENALAVLPTFAKMQSPLGAFYYAPQGTVVNQGDDLVNPYEVAVENNISIYAGLNILRQTLQATLAHDDEPSSAEKKEIQKALALIGVMLDGGKLEAHRTTKGLHSFFRHHAWHDGEFIQGGFANDPKNDSAWQPRFSPKAVDVNTWAIAALGAKRIDDWFGFGASFEAWQKVKAWGGYGAARELWGVGFSDRDGNGIDAQGNFRQGILSTEWTAGAIVGVREMMTFYRKAAADSARAEKANAMVDALQRDERSMLAGIERLRIENYSRAQFPETPTGVDKLLPRTPGAYLYASKRYLIPFGWYANPLPSTCSAAWVVMLEGQFNPFSISRWKEAMQ